jgi:hypothetical protein
MRWLKTTFVVLIVLVLAVVTGVMLFLNANGRAVFVDRVSASTNRNVSLGAVRLAFPMGLELDGLVIEGLLITNRAQVYVDPWSLLRGKLAFSSARLESPAFFIERGSDAAVKFTPSDSSTPPEAVTAAGGEPAKNKFRTLVLRKLVIENGALYVSDEKTQREWTIDKINGVVENIPLLSSPVRTRFFLTASLARLNMPFVGHHFKARGWVDWVARDMDAVAQVVDDGGQVGADMQLASKANDLLVKAKVRIAGKQLKQAREKSSGAVENAALGMLDAFSSEVDFTCSFHTRMDRFDVGQVALSGNVSADLPPGGTVPNIVAGLKSVGEEFTKQGGAEKKP